MVLFTDSSFAKNVDLTTQLVLLILVSYKTDLANVLHFNSYKSNRAVHSVLGGYANAFVDFFYAAFMDRHDLEEILHRKTPMTILTDS